MYSGHIHVKRPVKEVTEEEAKGLIEAVLRLPSSSFSREKAELVSGYYQAKRTNQQIAELESLDKLSFNEFAKVAHLHFFRDTTSLHLDPKTAKIQVASEAEKLNKFWETEARVAKEKNIRYVPPTESQKKLLLLRKLGENQDKWTSNLMAVYAAREIEENTKDLFETTMSIADELKNEKGEPMSIEEADNALPSLIASPNQAWAAGVQVPLGTRFQHLDPKSTVLLTQMKVPETGFTPTDFTHGGGKEADRNIAAARAVGIVQHKAKGKGSPLLATSLAVLSLSLFIYSEPLRANKVAAAPLSSLL